MRDEHHDFPAAHSMDSGWFAIDKRGQLAHFDTGEAGALLTATPYMTGESGTERSQQLYEQYIAPWIAQHIPQQELGFDRGVEMLVFFGRDEDALALARTCDEVALVAGRGDVLVTVKDSESLRERLSRTPGFIGMAPRDLFEFFELYYYPDSVMPSPVAFYNHGEWDVPGHYVRRVSAVPGVALHAPCHQLDTVFEQAQEIHLAEIDEDYNFAVWGDGDLSGYPPPPPPRTPPGQELWAWLSGFFGKKKDS